MRKVLGVLTEDFRLYPALVAALRARDVPFVSLSFTRRIPENVGAIVTSPAGAGRIRRPDVIAVEDVHPALAKAGQALQGKTSWDELLVGIDPGAEPGVAFVGDGKVLDARVAGSPEEVAGIVRDTLRTFPARRHRIRVGHGGPTNRKQTPNPPARGGVAAGGRGAGGGRGDPTTRTRTRTGLAREGLPAEIVDEAGTTERTEE